MVFDEVRNKAYGNVISKVVRPDSLVLDLGAGLGVLGLMAAAAGAQKVFLVDPAPVVSLGADLANQNGVGERIEVLRHRIEDLSLEGEVDVIVSVFTGNFLLSEDLLPSLFLARDLYLKPDGALIPSGARMNVALVTAENYFDEHVAKWSEPTLGIDFSPVRRLAGNDVFYNSAKKIGATMLSAPVCLQEYDFATATTAECQSSVEIHVKTPGTCHGILGWFDMLLGDEWLSTGPEAEPTHWSLAFLPLDPPMRFTGGERVKFELNRPEFGEWTWTVSCGDQQQRHSTFQSKKVDIEQFRKLTDDFTPELSSQGSLALYVLEQIKAHKSLKEIREGFSLAFPGSAKKDPQIESRIRKMFIGWSE